MALMLLDFKKKERLFQTRHEIVLKVLESLVCWLHATSTRVCSGPSGCALHLACLRVSEHRGVVLYQEGLGQIQDIQVGVQ